MCIIELVDYNENMLSASATAADAKPRTRRRGGKKKETDVVNTDAPAAAIAPATIANEPTKETSANTDTASETKDAE